MSSKANEIDYASRNFNAFFIPYELRTLARPVSNSTSLPPSPPCKFQGILMDIRLDERQSKVYGRSVMHYAIRSACIGAISATVTSMAELILSGKSSTRRAALLGFSNALKRVNKRYLHVLALIVPAIVETLSLYVHTLRTANRIKVKTIGPEQGKQYDRQLTRLFVMEQLRHALLGLPRPYRPALSEVPTKGRGTIAMRIIASIVAPLWAVKQIWTALNRYNNGLKTVLTIVASKTLPTVVARSYLPFAAVPGWALWNFLKARKVMTECMCFALGPTMAVDCLNQLLESAVSQTPSPSRLSSLLSGSPRATHPSQLPIPLKQAIIRACAISILTYSATTPYPVIKGDSNRPAHLHRHAALEALLEHANTELGHPCKGIKDLDSVDEFIKVTLPGLRKSHQLTVMKVLALGLVINGSISLKDKIIFGRALRAVGASVFNKVDLNKVVREFQRGRLSADSIEKAFIDFNSARWGGMEDEEELKALQLLKEGHVQLSPAGSVDEPTFIPPQGKLGRKRALVRTRYKFLRKRWRRKRRELLRNLVGLSD